MTHPVVLRLQGRVRRRRIAIVLALALPSLLAVAIVLVRHTTGSISVIVVGILAALVAASVLREYGRVDHRSIMRGLDLHVVDFEDSADLLESLPD
jgi:uncharacterized membrane protein YeaQ/YmgE (transglycosylase-associated protein family)